MRHRQRRHRHVDGAVGLRNHAQCFGIERDADQAQGIDLGVDAHAALVLLEVDQHRLDLLARVGRERLEIDGRLVRQRRLQIGRGRARRRIEQAEGRIAESTSYLDIGQPQDLVVAVKLGLAPDMDRCLGAEAEEAALARLDAAAKSASGRRKPQPSHGGL